MSMPIIRPAHESDVEALCRLYVEFHEFHARGVPDRLLTLGDADNADCSDLAKNLEEILGWDDAALLVAEVDGRLVGFAEVYLRVDEGPGPRVTHRYGYLQSLMVTADSRRRGLGRRLLAAAEAWTREQGASELRLETWEFEASPLRFYEACGYRTLRRTMVHTLK